MLECRSCGLVQLDTVLENSADFYRQSGMHEEPNRSLSAWRRDTNHDDERRFKQLQALLPNSRVLDFGCGNGGFLLRAKTLAASVTGIELENRVREEVSDLDIFEFCKDLPDGAQYDLITAFHVIEHLNDPRVKVQELGALLAPGGHLVIEVPSSDDALLTLFDCKAFQEFSYWSQHLYLFNSETLGLLIRQAGLAVSAIKHVQRYPLSNHLYWLSNMEPGGHKIWSFLDSQALADEYERALANVGKTDTLLAYAGKD